MKNSLKRLENRKDYSEQFKDEKIESIELICNKTNSSPVTVYGFDGSSVVFQEGSFIQGNAYNIPFVRLEWDINNNADFFLLITYKKEKKVQMLFS